jgi:cell division inhibitor SepF
MNEKLKGFLGIVEKEGADYDDEDEMEYESDFDNKSGKSYTSKKRDYLEEGRRERESARKKIVLAEPEVFNETPGICDQLKNGYTVVINFEKVKPDEIKKTFYFLSGVVYTLNGSIQRIAKNVFVLAPNNIDIVSDNEDDLYSKDVINWEFDD